MTGPVYEFHVSRAARDRHRFAEPMFATTGNVVLVDVAASRRFAAALDRLRAAEGLPPTPPGDLFAMGLIDEALHLVVARYREQRDPRALLDALAWFEGRIGRPALDTMLAAFADQFPPVAVYRRERTAQAWLAGETDGTPHRAVALEELILLWLANQNAAFRPYRELFDDDALATGTGYAEVTRALRDYFETRPRFGPRAQNLIDMLRAPALAAPASLAAQLAWIQEHWGELLGDLVRRMLVALDVLKEEELAAWLRFHPPAGGAGAAPALGPSGREAVPSFADAGEVEAFSPDSEWMPRTVLIAKSVHVWLHQLSVAYGRQVHRLDEIPDEELDALARRGFNALWLIGLWERSRASQRIKQLCGNPDAAASAYSLHDYAIAGDLGGESAYENLRGRAGARGIRLASDMVPNHMGVDSRWVVEHPHWFLALGDPPFPSYRFDGPDLSSDPRVEIKIEDHYYDRTDAAVVFRRVDRASGETRYVYHGNDGTGFPWNDTAQLDYLKSEVREGVIQTILHVARKFPIIRFDAAMTLAKRHYQRLWFPEPGTGGTIPSRAERGLTRAELDRAMPREFWRDVVDRVAKEAPGTLLLAEAFWLMEGYFVRTLGMHRVYNSAFMNMMRDEQNANYRSVIKNTLEFDPDVLKRYVNFMNNPDERTAIDQFGNGDKYFGVCTLLATLPGLPMFGHGQIEGFTERYGMEFRRSLRDERPDPGLVARHEREIVPLLHARALFAEAREFLLYDCFTDQGTVNEDVFAYSNRSGDARALVVYNNRYADAAGWIRVSCAYADKAAGRQRQRSLGEALGASHDGGHLVAFRDLATGLEHLRRARDLAEQGLRVQLGAYQRHVFVEWRDLPADQGRPWGELCDALAGRGVPSLDAALRALELAPVHAAWQGLLDPGFVRAFAEASARKGRGEILAEAERRVRALLEAVHRFAHGAAAAAASLSPERPWPGTPESSAREALAGLEGVLDLPAALARLDGPLPEPLRAVLPTTVDPAVAAAPWGAGVAVEALAAAGRMRDRVEPERSAALLFDALGLREPLAEALGGLGLPDEERWRAAARVRAAFAHAATAPGAATEERPVPPAAWIEDPDVAWAIGAHGHEDTRYVVQEPYERFVWGMAARPLTAAAAHPRRGHAELERVSSEAAAWIAVARRAGFRIDALFATGAETRR